jgi:hypothetical protein
MLITFVSHQISMNMNFPSRSLTLLAIAACLLFSACKKSTPASQTVTLGVSSFETFLSDNTNYPNGNPAAIEFLAESWTIGGEQVTGRTLFQFDLSTIKASGRPVKSAYLTLYSDTIPTNGDLTHANSGSTNDFYIQHVSSTWNANTTTWASFPSSDTVGRVYIPQTSQSFLNLVSMDVTTMVNGMVSGTNYGFVMMLKTESIYNCRIFCSPTYSDQGRRPKLVVTY